MRRAVMFAEVGGGRVPIGVVDLDDGTLLAPYEEQRHGKIVVDYREVGRLTSTALKFLNAGEKS